MTSLFHGEGRCHACGDILRKASERCRTCEVLDCWKLAVETSNTRAVVSAMKEVDIVLVVKYLKRLFERLHLRKSPTKRRTSGEFDFALQEIEKTARGLELTSIEAIGVLEMVKQSFVEEMFYDDYVADGEDEGEADGRRT